MRLLRPTITAAVITALGFAPAAYGVLAPTKASQLVTIYSTGSCPIPGFNAASSATFNQMVRADGTTVPFVVPPKQIFVMTDATITASGETAADAILAIVGVGTASAGAPIGARFEAVTSAGTVTAAFEFPAGVAIKGSSIACAEMLNLTHVGSVALSATAHGFFAPDK